MDESEYEFLATGDACEVCQALDGTNCTTLPHPNCSCQIVPTTKECTYELSAHEPTRRGNDVTFGGELTVICPDGSEISQSVEWHGSFSFDGGNWGDFAQPLIDATVQELCGQCPEASEPPLVS